MSDDSDLVFATTLFINCNAEDARRHLSEMTRVLKKGGQCVIICFIWNPMIERRTDIKALGQAHGTRTLHNGLNETAKAFDDVIQTHSMLRLSVTEIAYGHWSGCSTEPIYQDVVVSVKRASRK